VPAAVHVCLRPTLSRPLVRPVYYARMSTAATAPGSKGGVSIYETSLAVSEYLQFHFADDNDLLPYNSGVKDALGFTKRCADECLAAGGRARALDVGCAVGGQSFALSEQFDEVVGLDFSNMFVDAANKMKKDGEAPYKSRIEGDIWEDCTCKLPSGTRAERTFFEQGDACALKPAKELGAGGGLFDAVLASNLLCRLPDPEKFLKSLPDLVTVGGVVVLVSPYSWLEQWTPKDRWLGGYTDPETGKPKHSFPTVKEILEGCGFELVKEGDMPFLIREHKRKFQCGFSHLSVWRKGGNGGY